MQQKVADSLCGSALCSWTKQGADAIALSYVDICVQNTDMRVFGQWRAALSRHVLASVQFLKILLMIAIGTCVCVCYASKILTTSLKLSLLCTATRPCARYLLADLQIFAACARSLLGGAAVRVLKVETAACSPDCKTRRILVKTRSSPRSEAS